MYQIWYLPMLLEQNPAEHYAQVRVIDSCFAKPAAVMVRLTERELRRGECIAFE